MKKNNLFNSNLIDLIKFVEIRKKSSFYLFNNINIYTIIYKSYIRFKEIKIIIYFKFNMEFVSKHYLKLYKIIYYLQNLFIINLVDIKFNKIFINLIKYYIL